MSKIPDHQYISDDYDFPTPVDPKHTESSKFSSQNKLTADITLYSSMSTAKFSSTFGKILLVFKESFIELLEVWR